MLKHLKLTNIGPAPKMEIEFGKRLNLITGDNGLGKSFLLDIAWWALTRKWPADINEKLVSGLKVIPTKKVLTKPATQVLSDGGKKLVRKIMPSTIDFSFTGKTGTYSYSSRFERSEQAWTGQQGRPSNPGLVIYAQVDGSFSVWDPARNYWKKKGNIDVQERIPAYVFSPTEVWYGLNNGIETRLCNGLIDDWAGWQKENGIAFKNLCSVLEELSPSMEEKISPGALTRISLDDMRDYPTLKMPYGHLVPIVHASAGIRRVLALAYLLVWSWEEHKKASEFLEQPTSSQIIFLIDEIEAHLHPKWQRKIVSSLLKVMDKLTKKSEIQIITATHSPIIMASVEPYFDHKKDAWFDFDFEKDEALEPKVTLARRDFEKHGDVANWLTSEAFDLESDRPVEYEKIIHEASEIIESEKPDIQKIKKMHDRLVEALNPKDEFLFRWRSICQKKGWLE